MYYLLPLLSGILVVSCTVLVKISIANISLANFVYINVEGKFIYLNVESCLKGKIKSKS